MGRIGETIIRTWQTAHVMKQRRGALPGDAGAGADNMRARRYVAKYTIGPAVTHGLDAEIGSVRAGQAGRPGAVGAGLLRRPAAPGAQGRRDRLGQHGRRQRLDPDAAAAAAPADVRRLRRDAGPARPALRLARRARGAGLADRWESERPLVPTKDVSGLSKAEPAGERRAAGASTWTARRSRCASTASSSSRSPPPNCPWPSATSCSEPMNTLLLLLLDSRAPAGAHHHSGGMEAAVGTGLVSRPGRPGGLLPGQAPDFGPGRGRVRRRRGPASIRFGPNDLWCLPQAQEPVGTCWTPSSRRARRPRRCGRRRGSSGGGLLRLLRSVLPEADLVTPWARCAGPRRTTRWSWAPGSPWRAARRAGRAGRGAGGLRGPGQRAVRLLGLDPFAVQAHAGPAGARHRRVRGRSPRGPGAAVRAAGRRGAGPGPAGRLPSHRGGASVCILNRPATASRLTPSHGPADGPAGARAPDRHRRAGRQRQDGAGRRAVPGAVRRADHRRGHQRHLHHRGRRLPAPGGGAAGRPDPRRADRRLPAHGDPRRHQREPRRRRAARGRPARAWTWSWSRAAATT